MRGFGHMGTVLPAFAMPGAPSPLVEMPRGRARALEFGATDCATLGRWGLEVDRKCCCRATAPHAATVGGVIARSVQGRRRARPGIAAGEHVFDALSQGVVCVAIKAHA